MVYDYFKIFHILSAALLLASMTYCYSLWHTMNPYRLTAVTNRIQQQTWVVIIPASLVQLATGFTMISLKHYDLSELWLGGSVIGFIGVMAGWFGFLYFLLLAQQLALHRQRNQLILKYLFFRRIQSAMLSICGLAILSLVFFMANKLA